MKKIKLAIFIGMLLLVPVIKGEVEIPNLTNLTSKDMVILALNIAEFWRTKIESLILSFMGIF
ncbi:MAG: hypothetical protein H0Z28_13615 [Archaeoglobus sp.]|nr:hypothetical protein [Archaeoglobus sp.]